jgi:AbrB family looped-hinge helix DNA binding protein
MPLSYSKVTKKGQVTIPSLFRQQDGFAEGVLVAFKKTKDGLVIEPVHDMSDSAGKLSMFGTADEVIRDLIRSRERGFR